MPVQHWEYLARNLKKTSGKALEKDLNTRGLEGWELVALADGHAVFKRPTKPAPAAKPAPPTPKAAEQK